MFGSGSEMGRDVRRYVQPPDREGQSPILYLTTSSKVSTSCRLFGILSLTNTMERHPKSVKRDILYAYVNPICCRGPGDQINERGGGRISSTMCNPSNPKIICNMPKVAPNLVTHIADFEPCKEIQHISIGILFR